MYRTDTAGIEEEGAIRSSSLVKGKPRGDGTRRPGATAVDRKREVCEADERAGRGEARRGEACTCAM